MKNNLTRHLLAMLVSLAAIVETHAQSTAFTYQGRLTDGGSPANGLYDLSFGIFDADTAGTSLGSVTEMATVISNGLFTVSLDFGTGVFDGADRWLEIGVRSNGTASAFTTLSARQALTAAPYALHAASVNGADILGLVPNNRLPGNLVRSDVPLIELENQVLFRGPVEFDNPSGPPFTVVSSPDMVAGLNAEMLGNRSAQGFWQTGGNAGTTPGTHFLGTTDSQPLEIHAGGERVLRVEAVPGAGPRWAAGYFGNIASGQGATVGGGGIPASPNEARGHWSTIAGGFGNVVNERADYGTIGGGVANRIESDASNSSINGGYNNQIMPFNEGSAIGGGRQNEIQQYANESTICGGYQNQIGTNTLQSVIGGGSARPYG